MSQHIKARHRLSAPILPIRVSKCATEAKRSVYEIEASMTPVERAVKALELGCAVQEAEQGSR